MTHPQMMQMTQICLFFDRINRIYRMNGRFICYEPRLGGDLCISLDFAPAELRKIGLACLKEH